MPFHHEGSFEISSPKKEVYSFLTDPKKVATIIPDVENIKVVDPDNFELKAKVGISFVKGSVSMKFSIVEKKPPHYAKLKGRGTGIGSSVDIETSFTLEDGARIGTRVKWVADVLLGGMIVSVGSRLISAAAEKYINDVISSLRSKFGT